MLSLQCALVTFLPSTIISFGHGNRTEDPWREREPGGMDGSDGLQAISARTRSGKLYGEGDEKTAAGAGSDLWHSNSTVNCSEDVTDVIEE